MSNACLVNLLPRVGDFVQGTHKAGGKKPARVQRWCATCQTHFTGDLLEHRRTKEHKVKVTSERSTKVGKSKKVKWALWRMEAGRAITL